MIAPLDKQAQREVMRWVQEPDEMRFGLAGDTCYGWFAEQAEAVKQLSELLPVVYSGVAVGQLFKGKLKPDDALAHFVALKREAVAEATLTREEALSLTRSRIHLPQTPAPASFEEQKEKDRRDGILADKVNKRFKSVRLNARGKDWLT